MEPAPNWWRNILVCLNCGSVDVGCEAPVETDQIGHGLKEPAGRQFSNWSRNKEERPSSLDLFGVLHYQLLNGTIFDMIINAEVSAGKTPSNRKSFSFIPAPCGGSEFSTFLNLFPSKGAYFDSALGVVITPKSRELNVGSGLLCVVFHMLSAL